MERVPRDRCSLDILSVKKEVKLSGCPYLEYCTVAWSPHYVEDKVLLERIQRRFSRIIPGLKNFKV